MLQGYRVLQSRQCVGQAWPLLSRCCPAHLPHDAICPAHPRLPALRVVAVARRHHLQQGAQAGHEGTPPPPLFFDPLERGRAEAVQQHNGRHRPLLTRDPSKAEGRLAITRCPLLASALGRAPTTSPSPPVKYRVKHTLNLRPSYAMSNRHVYQIRQCPLGNSVCTRGAPLHHDRLPLPCKIAIMQDEDKWARVWKNIQADWDRMG
jgi:hypothetical protein